MKHSTYLLGTKGGGALLFRSIPIRDGDVHLDADGGGPLVMLSSETTEYLVGRDLLVNELVKLEAS